jgi:hypothetical protein
MGCIRQCVDPLSAAVRLEENKYGFLSTQSLLDGRYFPAEKE